MADIYMDRVCYKHGIEKPENELIEIHGFCDCDRCKWRKQSVNKGLRNTITATVEHKDRLEEAKEFVRNWKCNKREHTFKTEYVRF